MAPSFDLQIGAPVRSAVVNATIERGQVLTSICVVVGPVLVTVTTVWTVIDVACETVLRAAKLKRCVPVGLSKLRRCGTVGLEHAAAAEANNISPTNLCMRLS